MQISEKKTSLTSRGKKFICIVHGQFEAGQEAASLPEDFYIGFYTTRYCSETTTKLAETAALQSVKMEVEKEFGPRISSFLTMEIDKIWEEDFLPEDVRYGFTFY